MKKLINKFKERAKKYGKYILGIVGVGALLSQIVLPAVSIDANAPRFNFLQGDYELIAGSNVTKSETVWKDPVAGEVGDVVEARIYYHNGVLDSVAMNTTVTVNIPSETTNSQAKVSAAISADNADTVTDTIVDGNIVGLSGLTINLDKEADLELVPGSVKWYPDGATNPVALPAGQSGNAINSVGVNIGNIEGCWDFAGFITMQIKALPKPPPKDPGNLLIDKTVKNLSTGENAYTGLTNANQSDQVEFKIVVSNDGKKDVKDVYLKDILPSKLTAVSGTMRRPGFLATPIDVNELLGNQGILVGDVAPGVDNKVVVKLIASAPSQIFEQDLVTNIATAFNSSKSVSDDAKVKLLSGTTNVERSKSAFNVTKNVDAETVKAQAGDEIVYTLITDNTGSLPVNVIVEDEINDILEYADVTAISDGGYVDNQGFVVWPEATLNAGEYFEDTFTVVVINPLPENPQVGYSYDFVMWNVYGNEVVVEIEKPLPKPVFPVLHIEKTVRNITANELAYVNANTAYSGDALEYKIDFSNTGDGPADYVKVFDSLPANVSLDGAVPAILSINGVERSIAESIVSGYTIATLAPGDSGYIRFRAIIASGLSDGERLVNTGHLEDDGVIISDTAETIIKVKIIPTKKPPVLKPLPSTGSNVMLVLLVALVGTGIFAAIREFKFAKANR